MTMPTKLRRTAVSQLAHFMKVYRRYARPFQAFALLLAVLVAALLANLISHSINAGHIPDETLPLTQTAQVPDKAYQRGSTVVVGVDDPFEIIHPFFAATEGELEACLLVFESLLQPDSQGIYRGNVAESWSFDPSASQLTFTLDNTHVFRSGRSVEAKDVVLTYQQLMSPSYNGPFKGQFKEIEAVMPGSDNSQVIFQLKSGIEEPDLRCYTIGMINAETYPDDPEQVYQMGSQFIEPDGSGPYQLTSIQSDELVLALRPEYSGDVQQVIFKQIDDSQAFSLLADGSLDIIRCDWTERSKLRAANLGFCSIFHFSATVQNYFLINSDTAKTEAIKDPSQRHAVLSVVSETGPTPADIKALNQMRDKSLPLLIYQGLDQAVYHQNLELAESIADMLEEYGLTVEIIDLDWPNLAARLKARDYDILLLPATAFSRLPDDANILDKTVEPDTSAFVYSYRPEIWLASRRLDQIDFNPYLNPLSVIGGGWSNRIENVRILDQDGSDLEVRP